MIIALFSSLISRFYNIQTIRWSEQFKAYMFAVVGEAIIHSNMFGSSKHNALKFHFLSRNSDTS